MHSCGLSLATSAIVLSLVAATKVQWKTKRLIGCNDTGECEQCSYTWFSPRPLANGSTSCECGSDLGYVISCDKTLKHVEIYEHYCMTYGNDNASLVVGKCFFSPRAYHLGKYPRYDLPCDPSLLDQNCRQHGRTGQLCGKCMDGYAAPVYSYNLSCVNCTDYTYSWVKYGAAAFLPLTILYIAVIIFRISVTSGILDVFILVSQMATLPVLGRLYSQKHQLFSLSLGVSLYGIWNLDFFRLLYSPICIHPKITTLEALALDYIIAAYPLGLIAITFFLVELHDHNFRIIVWLWRPFHRCFVRFRRKWDIKSSLIHAFCTFLLLSYVKFLSASFDLLVPVRIFNAAGETLTKDYLLLEGSVEYFGPSHLPFGVLALVVALVFNVLPLIFLCLYPYRCFQRCLHHCRIQSFKLHVFMDAFQGCYKDGTAGSCDCRWFAALYLMIRIAVLSVIGIGTVSLSFGMLFSIFILQVLLFLIVVFQPYKTSIHNAVNIFLLIVVSLFGVSAMAEAMVFTGTSEFRELSNVFMLIFGAVPLLFFIGLILYKFFGHMSCTQKVFKRIHASIPSSVCGKMVRSDSEKSVPDRMLQYTALLAEPDSDTCMY